jgi:hypothetical protein
MEPRETKIDGKTTETTIGIADGQRNVSYERLFAPCLRGAKRVKMVHPYINLTNFVVFCKALLPTQHTVELALITSAASTVQERETADKLNDLRGCLKQHGIVLTYSFNAGEHGRWFETDTGWRVELARGLDIFKKEPEQDSAFDFGEQARRKCKATTITYRYVHKYPKHGRRTTDTKAIKEITVLIGCGDHFTSLLGFEYFFPEDSFGGEDSKNPGTEIRLRVRGLPDVVTTDIVKGKSVIRKSDWRRTFCELHNLTFRDAVAVKNIADYEYEVYPKVSP